jgi:hypothetical protein
MKLSIIPAFLVLSTLFLCSCTKDKEEIDELRGTWVNQNTPRDTLVFSRKNGKYLLNYNNSFNPSLPVRTELEYSLKDSVLTLIPPVTSSAPVYNIKSFKWIKRGEEFKILGIELYMFMASTVAEHQYKKIK